MTIIKRSTMGAHYLPFEHFEAESEAAPVCAIKNGFITIKGHSFFDRSLKSRRLARAFVDHTAPFSLAVCVISMAGNYLCRATETDAMGLEILKPEGLQLLTEMAADGFWVTDFNR